MKIKDNQGNEMTLKEAGSRWKKGIDNVTPLQQCGIAMIGYFIQLIGIAFGIYYAAAKLKQTWLILVLSGAFIVTAMAALANLQRIKVFRKIAEIVKEIPQPIQDDHGGYIG